VVLLLTCHLLLNREGWENQVYCTTSKKGSIGLLPLDARLGLWVYASMTGLLETFMLFPRPPLEIPKADMTSLQIEVCKSQSSTAESKCEETQTRKQLGQPEYAAVARKSP
jgi:hypothetical protein